MVASHGGSTSVKCDVDGLGVPEEVPGRFGSVFCLVTVEGGVRCLGLDAVRFVGGFRGPLAPVFFWGDVTLFTDVEDVSFLWGDSGGDGVPAS